MPIQFNPWKYLRSLHSKEATANAEKEVSDLGDLDLKARDVEASDDKITKRNWKHKLYNIACDVTCNSIVLGLDQKERLKICKEKC